MLSQRLSILIALVFLVSCADDGNLLPSNGECIKLSGSFPEFLPLPPVGDNGSYDPTLAGDPETGRVWMVFSRVDGKGGEGKISTHLGYSDDNGTTWCYANEINTSEDVMLSEVPNEFTTAISAHWSHEVPSIAFDPNAPVNERWRITWHRYLHLNDGVAANDDRQFAYGWIAMKTASDPLLLAEAPEIKLFSAIGYYKSVGTESYNNQVGGLPLVRLHDLHPELSGGIVFTEPGMQVIQNELYVSLVLGNVTAGNSVVLIKYNNGSKKWSYVSTLLTPAQAQTMNPGWTNFSATDLFVINGQAYLLVSPADKLYDGLLLFKLNLNTGLLHDADGNGPDVVWNLPTTIGSEIIQTGVGTYDELSYNSGIIYGDAVNLDPQFRLYATGFIPQ